MKFLKVTLLITVFTLLFGNVHALEELEKQELIADFEEESVSVLNEELRRLWDALETQDDAVNDLTDEGAVVQVVNTLKTAYQMIDGGTGTSQIPSDNTIPGASEGDVVLTRAITPSDAANKLLIQVVMSIGESTGPSEYHGMSLCQDGSAAIAAVPLYLNSSQAGVYALNYYMTAGTVSETTFTVRVGPDNTADLYINGDGGSQIYGGVATSSITITEISS